MALGAVALEAAIAIPDWDLVEAAVAGVAVALGESAVALLLQPVRALERYGLLAALKIPLRTLWAVVSGR